VRYRLLALREGLARLAAASEDPALAPDPGRVDDDDVSIWQLHTGPNMMPRC
jgi:hypothetical protein